MLIRANKSLMKLQESRSIYNNQLYFPILAINTGILIFKKVSFTITQTHTKI